MKETHIIPTPTEDPRLMTPITEMIPTGIYMITHSSLASHKWDLDKRCRPRSDATEFGVWSGSTLFVCVYIF